MSKSTLRADLVELVYWASTEGQRGDNTRRLIAKVIAEQEEMQVDAERWRFWRKTMPFAKTILGGVKVCFPNWPAPPMRGYHEEVAATLDAAVDAARRLV